MSKLHHARVKLEYAVFIWVAIHFALGHALFISGIHFVFGYICSFHFKYTLYIWVCSFHLGIQISFRYALFIWVYYHVHSNERPTRNHFLINAHPSGVICVCVCLSVCPRNLSVYQKWREHALMQSVYPNKNCVL